MHFLLGDDGKEGVLINSQGDRTHISHHIEYHICDLWQSRRIDTLIIEPEDGFSQLGGVRQELEDELGLGSRDLRAWVLNNFKDDFEPNLSSLADFARFTDPDITLTAIASRNDHSDLKGVVLVPYESSTCYLQYSNPYSKPYRDFFYNVTYEALYYAYHLWGSRKFCLTHLCRGKIFADYKIDVTTCQAEAIRHFCELHRGVVSVIFWDNCLGNSPVYEMSRFDKELVQGEHRPLERSIEKRLGFDFIRLDLPLHNRTKDPEVQARATD